MAKKRMSRKQKRKLMLERCTLQFVSLPLIFIYYELLLMLIRGTNITYLYATLFAAGIGLVAGCLISLLPKKFYLPVKGAVIGIVAVLFITETLIKSSFQQYMPFSAIKSGAGGVVGHYISQTFAAILHGIPVIILYFLPLIGFILTYKYWRVKTTHHWKYRGSMALFGVLFFSLAVVLSVNGKFSSNYKENFSFNTATQTFGLLTSLRLNTKYKLFGNEHKSGFAVTDTTATASASSEESTSSESTAVSASTETASTAAAADTASAQPAVDYGKNEIDIDFDSLIASSTDETVTQMHEYVKSLTASSKNEYTGVFKGKNLILICAEALSGYAVSEELTPTLYRLVHNGFYFEDYYQPSWGGSTSTGEYSFLTGLIPIRCEETMLATQGVNMYYTLGNTCQRLGYTTYAFHNGDAEYYSRNLTHNNLGYSQFIASLQGLEDIIGYTYPSDTETFDQTLPLYKDQQPFSVYYMTLSGHSNYDASSPFVDEYLDQVNAVYGDTIKDTTKYYLCKQKELDNALSVLIADLEAAGIADDTVIALSPDHYPYGLEQSATFGNDEDYLADLYGYEYTNWWNLDCTCSVLWSECMEKDPSEEGYVAPKTISSPTYSIDFVPTLLNLFGVDFDSRLLPGRDVLASDTEPLVIWENYSWLTDTLYYDSSSGECILTDGSNSVAGDEYSDEIARINNIVNNKILYSDNVLTYDYYRIIFGDDVNT